MQNASPTTTDEPLDHRRDPRVDAYIAKAAPFAQPVLSRLRDAVHAACPEVEETIKWSMPFFDYHGSPLCHMAAFKAHAAFGFWRGKELPDLPKRIGDDGMGHLGRLTSIADLPAARVLTTSIRTAMQLTDSSAKPARAKAAARPAPTMPADLAQALDAAPMARAAFDAFTPGARREYIEWVVEAKREATRASRIATAVEWISEGKTRHWKYQTIAAPAVGRS